MPYINSNFLPSNFLSSNYLSSNFVSSYATGPVIVQMTTPDTVWMGDSITAGVGTNSIADWTAFFLMGRLVPIVGYNQGVSGNQTSQMIARQATGLALNPILYMILGGTNDIVVGGLPASTIQTNLQTLIDNAKATASVQYVCIRTILKRTGLTAGQEAVRVAVNNWIMAISDPKVISVNYDNSDFDPATMTVDGLHPNNYGVVLLARFTANALSTYIAATDVLADTTGNLLPTNGDLAGTGGGQTGSSGQVATGYQVRNFIGGVSCTNSKGTLDGHISQIMVLNGTPTANSFVQFRAPVSTAVSVGATYEYMVRARITGTANMQNLSNTDSLTSFLAFSTGTVSAALNQNLDGIIRNGRVVTASAHVSSTIDMQVAVLSAGAVVSGLIIEVAQPIWRKIS